MRMWKLWQKTAFGAGAVVAALGAVVVRDVQRIDPTSGGYSAPYDDYSGQPIDWSTQEVTSSGFRDRGGVLVDTSLDCTTGQIRFHVGPLSFDYRELSERAIVVHEPHVACRSAGFEPQWEHPGDLAASDGNATSG